MNIPGKGWTVWELKTQGDRVIGKEVISRAGMPEAKGVAWETLRRAVSDILYWNNTLIKPPQVDND